MAFFSSTLATNPTSSGLLAYRICRIERLVSPKRTRIQGPTMPILRAPMDAAVLSMVLFTMLVCFILSNIGQYVILDMIVSIISITFYMVLICVAINQQHGGFFSTVGTSRRKSGSHAVIP